LKLLSNCRKKINRLLFFADNEKGLKKFDTLDKFHFGKDFIK
jgi:hypothetical protein